MIQRKIKERVAKERRKHKRVLRGKNRGKDAKSEGKIKHKR